MFKRKKTTDPEITEAEVTEVEETPVVEVANCANCKDGLVGDPESTFSRVCDVCHGTGKVN